MKKRILFRTYGIISGVKREFRFHYSFEAAKQYFEMWTKLVKKNNWAYERIWTEDDKGKIVWDTGKLK